MFYPSYVECPLRIKINHEKSEIYFTCLFSVLNREHCQRCYENKGRQEFFEAEIDVSNWNSLA